MHRQLGADRGDRIAADNAGPQMPAYRQHLPDTHLDPAKFFCIFEAGPGGIHARRRSRAWLAQLPLPSPAVQTEHAKHRRHQAGQAGAGNRTGNRSGGSHVDAEVLEVANPPAYNSQV